MSKRDFYHFFDWATSGAAAASLAFFGLLLSTEIGNYWVDLIAVGLFLFAMFALVAASAIGKMIRERDEPSNEAERMHHLTTGAGLATFTSGLALTAVNVSNWLTIPLVIGLWALLIAIERAHNSLTED